MRTDIGIPKPISDAAEQLAQRLGMPLNELYTTAIATYVTTHQPDITDLLNQVYATASSAIDPMLLRAQVASVGEETW